MIDGQSSSTTTGRSGVLTEAIILAGGLGTRLRSAVPDLPKCMAPVAGRPFIAYIIDQLEAQGLRHFIFALGYKSQLFESFLKEKFPEANYSISIEDEPLGTGGAVKLAGTIAKSNTVLVVNGDTYFDIRLSKLASFHHLCGADCTISLKPMKAMDRYGVVELAPDYRIHQFFEKKYYDSGLINGGIYALNLPSFLKERLPEKFSFEKDYLELYFSNRRIYGVVQDAYFIDIGIPADYERAQLELPLVVRTV